MHAIHKDCPRCGGRTTSASDSICEYCSINMPLYAKARDMSNAHYDEGLQLANARNLTASIEALTAAVRINKKNIRARNLLGLCYHAVGRIGEALREWVISANYGTDDNPAKEYLVFYQDDIPTLEKYSDGLYNYNEALQFMIEYSEDLAAIRLKRAIEIIPNFVDAMNLLALFYIKVGDKREAGMLIERVLAIDNGNPFARRYYREIFQRKVPPPKKLRAQGEDSGANTPEKAPLPPKTERQNPFAVQSQRPVPKASPISGILLFVAGLGAMFLFMYVLVLPSFLEDSLAEAAALSAELSSRQAAHAEQISGLDETIAELQDDVLTLQQLLAGQEERNRNLQSENWVNTAYAYLSQDLAREALAMLENVETARLTEDVRSLFNLVQQTAMPIVEEDYHAVGLIHFTAGNYSEARYSLERAAQHITDDSTVAHDVFYLLGRIAEVQEDFGLARIHYEMVINQFPGSNRVNAATARLNQLPE